MPVLRSLRTALRGLTRAGATLRRSRFFVPVLVSIVLLSFLGANAVVAITVSAAAHVHASSWPGPSFTFWPERSWQTIERRIRGLSLPPRITSSVCGEVSYRQGAFAVHLFRVRPAQPGTPLRVLLTAGVHGTEPAGVEALLRFVERLARDPSRLPGAFIDVVPIVNPWGYVYGYRYNGDGQDVNRDYASHRTQEAVLIRDLIREDGPFDLVVDLHESKNDGYFLYEYRAPAAGMGGAFASLVSGLGLPQENAYREWIFRARDGILRTPAAVLPWVALARSLSLDEYARMRGTADTYTVETPVSGDFEQRVDVDLRALSLFITLRSAAQAAR